MEEKKLCPFRMNIKTSEVTDRTILSKRTPCDRGQCAVWDEGRKGCSMSATVAQAHHLDRIGTGLEKSAGMLAKMEITLGYMGNALRHLLPSEGVDATVPGRMAAALEKIGVRMTEEATTAGRQMVVLERIAASVECLATTNDSRLDRERRRARDSD